MISSETPHKLAEIIRDTCHNFTENHRYLIIKRKKMNEYWIVTENKTGRTICHCADINDAMMMVGFDPHHRSYSRHRFIMDQVITVTSTTDKQLPGQIRTSCCTRTISIQLSEGSR
jgi:phosphorylcholine metabolism protein LicD